MTRVAYSPHLVTYLDIMGFRNLIENKSPGFISKVIRLWKQETALGSESQNYHVDFKQFSDLIVVTCPINSRENVKTRPGLVFWEVQRLMFAQARLIEEGILVRGAVTVGNIVKSYREIYGPAILQAYELESRTAIFPRIVIDERILTELKRNILLRRHDFRTEMEYLSVFLHTDNKNVTFVDYLRGALSEDPEGAPRFFVKHKELIEQGLWDFRRNRRIREKYRWLQRYHNSVVQELRPKKMGKRLII